MSKQSDQLPKSPRIPKWLKTLLEFAVAGLLIMGILWWQERNLLSDDGSVQAPQEFQVESLIDGDLISLQDAYQNKPTLVYFFAPWCSICRLSAPNLNDLSSDINVVSIALSYKNREDVQAFVDESGLEIPVFLGSSNIQRSYNIEAFPTYYLIDEQGNITDRSVGYSTEIGMKFNIMTQ